MNRTGLRCEVLESRDAMSATLVGTGEPDSMPSSYEGTHVLYQDIFIPAARSNQGWGKWEVNLSH